MTDQLAYNIDFSVQFENVKDALNSINRASPSEQIIGVIDYYVKENPVFFDSQTKIWWVWNHDDNCWKIGNEVDVLRDFKERYGFVDWLISNVKTQLIMALEICANKKPQPVCPEWIQFKDCVVNFKTGEVTMPEAKDFWTNPLPIIYGESGDTPTMDRLFAEWCGQENVQLMYELIAYCLLRAYPISRIFFMVGSGANGKTTFLKLIHKFLGDDNVTSSDLKRLKDSRFETARLINKLFCEIGETDISFFYDTALLKALVGESLIPCELKNKEPFDFVNYAKMFISTNNLPITSDNSDGFFRRSFVLEFPNKFAEKMDILSTVPEIEFKNLAYKSVKILKDMIENGKFNGEIGFEERRERYENMSNPVRTFIMTFYERGTFKDMVLKAEFKEKLKKWLEDIHFYKKMSDQMIGKALSIMGYETDKHRDNPTESPRWYIVGLKEKVVPSVPEKSRFPTQTLYARNQLGNDNLLEQMEQNDNNTPISTPTKTNNSCKTLELLSSDRELEINQFCYWHESMPAAGTISDALGLAGIPACQECLDNYHKELLNNCSINSEVSQKERDDHD